VEVVARHYLDARWVELTIEQAGLTRVQPARGSAAISAEDDWVAPAFFDIQTNGRFGQSFASPHLTVERTVEIVRAHAPLGTARLCPTLITAPHEHLLHGLRTIDAACAAFPDVASQVVGIHLEGPFISERDGYRGAHPANAICDPDWNLFRDLQSASGGRIVLITLAPERRGSIAFIREVVASGVVVALGHTAADGDTIRRAVSAGATLTTHLGNGIATPLARHPNPIWDQAATDELAASFIADGHHLDLATLRVLARAKGPARTILVSDFSPLAGLPPGTYGEWAVDPSGKIVVTGTPYLAGANQGTEIGLENLLRATGWTLPECIAAATSNPARLLRVAEPRLALGEAANLVVFRFNAPSGFVLERTCVDGVWHNAANGPPPM
jgi:N-acetylglucosamine-6-phosphate deacetylase